MALVDVQQWTYNSETVSVAGTVDGTRVGATAKYLPLKKLIDDFQGDRTKCWPALKVALAKILKNAHNPAVAREIADAIEV